MAAIVGSILAFSAKARAFTFIDTINGSGMDDALLTVNFKDGSTETAIFVTTGAEASAAIGTDFSLSVDGANTIIAPWLFEYTGDNIISSVVVDLSPTNIVFDSLPWPEGTPGTGIGNSLISVSGLPPTNTIYSNPVQGTLGDIFNLMETFWNDGYGKEDGPSVWGFDTDLLVPDPDPEPIPEPTAILGLIVGVGGCCFAVRKSR